MSTLMIDAEEEFPSVADLFEALPRAYLVVIERGDRGWGAYLPDVPGVVAAAETEEDVRLLIADAFKLHAQAVLELGETLPKPFSRVAWVTA